MSLAVERCLAIVVANVNLPAGTTSAEVPVREVRLELHQGKFGSKDKQTTIGLQVIHNDLQLPGMPIGSWVNLLSFAEDVHSETARLVFAFTSLNKLLKIVISRNLKKGEAIKLWFASDVASELGLPFLNFSHINGDGYHCPTCNIQFNSPNPLKLHIATDCDSKSSSFLWERLCISTNFGDLPLLNPSSSKVFSFYNAGTTQVLPGSPLNKPKPTSPDSTSGPNHNCLAIRNHSSSLRVKSAFRPVGALCKKQNNVTSLNKNLKPSHLLSYVFSAQPHLTSCHTLPHAATSSIMSRNIYAEDSQVISSQTLVCSSPGISLASNSFFQNVKPFHTTTSIDPCAEVEALVSNLGRSKGGHLCIYCGKVYSRKYGLKIHIRTHTGYKPLKCKVCFRPFGDPSNLNKHVRLHSEGETPYKCDFCGKILVRRRDLDRHLRSRHPGAIDLLHKNEKT